MKLCPGCGRHLRAPEACCPFCGAEQRSSAAVPTAGILATVLLSACLSACTERTPGDTTGTATSDTTATTTTTTTGVTPTTTAPTSMTGSTSSTTLPDPTSESSVSSNDPSLDTGDPGCSFYAGCPPDVGSAIECDVFKQDCAPGEKCTAWAEGGGGAWNATKCVPVTGMKAPGDMCMAEGSGVSGIDDCQAGAMCWNVDDMNMGTCVALCKGTPNAPICDDNISCAIFNNGVLNLCLPACDPLLQDCPGDDLCLMIGEGFICAPDDSGDMGKTNDPCEFANACDKGLVCLDTANASSDCMQGSQGCCQPFCDFVAMEPCPNPDQKCVQWFDPMMPIPPGFEDVGVCAIP